MERKSVVESLPLMIIGSKYRINSFFHSKILTFFVTIYSFEIFSLLSSLFLSIQIAETLLIAVGGCTWQRGKHIPKKYFLSFVSQTQVCRAGEGVAGRSWAEANVFQNFKEKEFFQTKKRFHERRRVTREVTALECLGLGDPSWLQSHRQQGQEGNTHRWPGSLLHSTEIPLPQSPFRNSRRERAEKKEPTGKSGYLFGACKN